MDGRWSIVWVCRLAMGEPVMYRCVPSVFADANVRFLTDVIQVPLLPSSLLLCSVLVPRYPVITVGPPSGLAHPSQLVWLSHAHHETPEQSKISSLTADLSATIAKAAFAASRAVACLVRVAPAEALKATGGSLPSSTSRDPRHAQTIKRASDIERLTVSRS